MADRSISVRLRAEVSQYMASMRQAGRATANAMDDAEKATKRVDDATSRVAKRANVQFNLLATTIATALPAASSAAIGALTTGAAAGFAAFGAVALRENTAIRQSFASLSDDVQLGLAEDAAVLESTYVGAADRLGAAYSALRPQLRDAFEASAPAVNSLTDGVIALAHNAMPGLVSSVQRSGPIFEGFESLLGDTGSAVGEFFDIVTQEADDVGDGVEHVGTLLRETLTGLGPILGDLSSLWATNGDEFAQAVGRILDVIGELSGGAMPVLSASINVALDLLNSVLTVLEPIAGAIGPVVGMWLSLAAAMKIFGAAKGAVTSAVGSIRDLGNESKKTQRNMLLMRGAGVAVALGLHAIFDAAGSLNPQLDELQAGLKRMADGGKVSGEAARVFGEDLGGLADALDTVSADGFSGFAEGATKFVGDLVGIESNLGLAEDKIKAFDDVLANMVRNGELEAAGDLLAAGAKKAGVSIDDLKGQLPGYKAAVDAAKASYEEFGLALGASRPGLDSLRESLKTLADQTADTADRADALNTAWRELFGIALDLEDAQVAFEGGLDDIADSLDDVKKSTSSWRSELLAADGTINETTEAGRDLHEQLTEQGNAYRDLAEAAYSSTLKQTGSQEKATAAAVKASQTRYSQFVKEMRQLGFTEEQAKTLANRYLGMPSQVSTLIRTPGLAGALEGLRRFRNAIYSIPLTRTTTLSAIIPGQALAAMSMMQRLGFANGGLVPGYASGGLVGFPTGGQVRGPGGPRTDSIVAALSAGEFVVNAKATQDNLELLQAINSGRVTTSGVSKDVQGVRSVPSFASGGGGTTVVVNAPNYLGTPQELFRAVRKEVSKSYGGDVQKAFGR